MVFQMACFFLAYEVANFILPSVVQGWRVRKKVCIGQDGITITDNEDKTPFRFIYVGISLAYWVFLIMAVLTCELTGILMAIGIFLVGQTFGKSRPTKGAIRWDAALCAVFISLYLVSFI